jgi:putative transcription factor
LRCEVCGRKIFGAPYRVIIEGAKLTVCNQCAKHGTIIKEEALPKPSTQKLKTPLQPLQVQTRKPPEIKVDTSLEIVDGFDQKIRQAREKMGLSHKELGKKINEKVSLLRKIETRKTTPDNKLAAKLERLLKIKLIVPVAEEKVPQTKVSKTVSRERTLGDLIQLSRKDKKQGETAERKQS